MKMKIEILVSTLNAGIENIKVNTDFNYLIIHQVSIASLDELTSLAVDRLLKYKNVRYIRSNTLGLSKSRNMALDASLGEYVWIMDDDVTIKQNALSDIEDIVSKEYSDIYILNHNEVKENSSEKFLNRFNSFHVSSIDMLLSRCLISKGLRFDESFGLGTNKPSGEEYIFISDSIKSGLKVKQTTKVVSIHPALASGLDFFSDSNKIRAKKMMFNKTFGWAGYILFFLFSVKKIKTIWRGGYVKLYIKTFLFS